MALIDYNLAELCSWLVDRRRWFPTNVLIIGCAQSGKSTLAQAIAETIYAYDGKAFTTEFVDRNTAFNARQGIEQYDKLSNDVVIADEMYFFADSRTAMSYIQVKFIGVSNFLASRHNIIISVMQDYTDLDLRIKAQTDVGIFIGQMGEAAVFMKDKKYPIIKRQLINTDRFEKKPGLLEENADYEIRKDRNYIFDVRWGARKDAIWDYYDKVKRGWQSKTLEGINKKLERLDNSAEKIERFESLQQRTRVKEKYSREELEAAGLLG